MPDSSVWKGVVSPALLHRRLEEVIGILPAHLVDGGFAQARIGVQVRVDETHVVLLAEGQLQSKAGESARLSAILT